MVLCDMVPSLSRKFAKNAWHVLMDEFELDPEQRPSEMAFQQGICTPFSRLLMAAAGENGLAGPSYNADDDVCSSMSIIRKSKAESAIQEKSWPSGPIPLPLYTENGMPSG